MTNNIYWRVVKAKGLEVKPDGDGYGWKSGNKTIYWFGNEKREAHLYLMKREFEGKEKRKIYTSVVRSD